MQATRAQINAFVRKARNHPDYWLRIPPASHIRSGRNNQHRNFRLDRVIPVGYGAEDWPLIETTLEDGTVDVRYQGDPYYSGHQIAEYVRKFCELNHLKG